MTPRKIKRREALGGMAGAALVAGCARTVVVERLQPLAMELRDPESGELRVIRRAPGDDLANSNEFGEQAQLVMPPELFATVEGGNREAFNRISFRPRVNRSGLDLDLSVSLFGEDHFTPLLIGPVGDLARYHPDGEMAMVRGAAAARTAMVVSSASSVPLRDVVARAYSPIWYGLYSEPSASEQARRAAGEGASVIVVSTARPRTDGSPPGSVGSRAEAPIDWTTIDAIRQATDLPIVIKGIMTAADSARVVRDGYQGVIVSNHGVDVPTASAPLDVLPQIVEEVDGRVPVLVDGSVRRGTDVLKALLLGANATLVARPAVWALAAYGSDGVFWMLDLIQNELARSSIMVGVRNVEEMTSDYVRIHSQATA